MLNSPQAVNQTAHAFDHGDVMRGWKWLLIGVLLWCLNAGAPAQESKIWTLVDVIDDSGQQRIRDANAKSRGQWRYAIDYVRDAVRGSSDLQLTYTGPTRKEFRPPQLTGTTLRFNATWSTPPAVIKGGEKVSLKLAGKVAESSHEWKPGSMNVTAQVVSKASDGRFAAELRRFRNAKNVATFSIGGGNAFAPFSETVTALFPTSAKDGTEYAIKVTVASGNMVTSATYVYVFGAPHSSKPVIRPYLP